MADDLSGLFFGPTGGNSTLPWMGGVMTVWDAVTYANTVVVGGAVTYTDLPVINPAGLSTGQVLLAQTPAGPIVLGRIYQAT